MRCNPAESHAPTFAEERELPPTVWKTQKNLTWRPILAVDQGEILLFGVVTNFPQAGAGSSLSIGSEELFETSPRGTNSCDRIKCHSSHQVERDFHHSPFIVCQF